jgi:hypothetical protein
MLQLSYLVKHNVATLMKKKYKYLLVACLAVALVDAIGSFASRVFNFNYILIWPASVLVYAILGFILTKIENIKASVCLTALLGVFDATVGWEISILLKANTSNMNNQPTLQQWAITIIAVALYGAFVGLISGGIAKLFRLREKIS